VSTIMPEQTPGPLRTISIEPVTPEIAQTATWLTGATVVVERIGGRLTNIFASEAELTWTDIDSYAAMVAQLMGDTFLGWTRPVDVAAETAMWEHLKRSHRCAYELVLAAIEDRSGVSR